VISEEGSGAVIQYVPDAPIDLVNLPEITDAEKIGLSWNAGVSDGGISVIDYKIFYALEGEAYTELVSGVVPTTYTTTEDLIDG
jgi:hypothetical protein